MILGLDASASCIGWTILANTGEYKDCGFLKLDKEKNLYKKLDILENFIDEKLIGLKDLKIFVESALLMFRTRSSMASVIARLQEVNGMYRALLYKKLRIEPVLINVMTARKLAGLVIPRKENTKEFVLAHVQSLGIIPKEKWQYNKKGKNQRTNFDIADATIIAIAAYEELKLNGG